MGIINDNALSIFDHKHNEMKLNVLNLPLKRRKKHIIDEGRLISNLPIDQEETVMTDTHNLTNLNLLDI